MVESVGSDGVEHPKEKKKEKKFCFEHNLALVVTANKSATKPNLNLLLLTLLSRDIPFPHLLNNSQSHHIMNNRTGPPTSGSTVKPATGASSQDSFAYDPRQNNGTGGSGGTGSNSGGGYYIPPASDLTSSNHDRALGVIDAAFEQTDRMLDERDMKAFGNILEGERDKSAINANMHFCSSDKKLTAYHLE